MPRITRVYTRTGDDGTTALGTGRRVDKASPRISAYGTVDELNSCVGAAVAAGVGDELAAPLTAIQNQLFHLGAELCVPPEDRARRPVPGVTAAHVQGLEALMDRLTPELPPLQNFVLPGGSAAAAHLHVARAVCRRAEREVLALARAEAVGEHVIPYLNRLSDALFVMARHENHRAGLADRIWDKGA